jgi:methylated-DNA-[protein]-cysteine S-methyltransferase
MGNLPKATTMTSSSRIIDSPIGPLKLTMEHDALIGVDWAAPSEPILNEHAPEAGALDRVESELSRYFAGELEQWSLELALDGTEFQQSVWAALQNIPEGTTSTYQKIAAAIGKPSAVRAVGSAIGSNPIPVIVPCHRVIGSNGSLTGFSGGLEKKTWLLRHEGILPANTD